MAEFCPSVPAAVKDSGRNEAVSSSILHDDASGAGSLIVFVNGVMNPKDEAEESWDERRASLASSFPLAQDFLHVHNPTMSISADRALNVLQKNSKLAFGASLLAFGAVVADAYLEKGYTAQVLVKSMEAMKEALQSQADKIAEKLAAAIEDAVNDRKVKAVARFERVTIVAHSHGGWVAKSWIESGFAEGIAAKHHVKLRVIAVGAPVLVAPGPGVNDVVQLHNQGDLISLHFDSDGEQSPHVVSGNRGAWHARMKYLEWLNELVLEKRVKEADKLPNQFTRECFDEDKSEGTRAESRDGGGG